MTEILNREVEAKGDPNNAPVAEKAYLGKNAEARKLAELGTLALVGHYPSQKAMLDEIHRLEKDPAHMKQVAADLAKINRTKDGLPVHASLEVDGSGQVTGLKFDSSKELEKIVYTNEYKYGQCIAEKGVRVAVPVFESQMALPAKDSAIEAIMTGARASCKDLDVPATAAAPVPPSHEFVVLNKQEQNVLSAIKTAMETHDEAALNAAVKPFVGRDWRQFMRIADTDGGTRPASYQLDGSKLDNLYFSNGSGGYFNIRSSET